VQEYRRDAGGVINPSMRQQLLEIADQYDPNSPNSIERARFS
jgi:hypothetical protein